MLKSNDLLNVPPELPPAIVLPSLNLLVTVGFVVDPACPSQLTGKKKNAAVQIRQICMQFLIL